jgi:hypothetical protein
VMKRGPAQGFLLEKVRAQNRNFHIVEFADIRRFMNMVYGDRYFMVGPLVIRRKTGWPMGGSLSEPGTLVDLTDCIRDLHCNVLKRENLGWLVDDLSHEETMQAVLHVDDCLLMSRSLCGTCLYAGLQKLWPADVGTELEGENPVIRFLQTILLVKNGDLIVLPFSPNIEFALGITEHQKIARMGDFANSSEWSFMHLRRFVVSQVLTINNIVGGDHTHITFFALILTSELLALNWPLQWIGKSFLTIPRKHQTGVVRFFRFVGVQIKRNPNLNIQILQTACRGTMSSSYQIKEAIGGIFPSTLQRD